MMCPLKERRENSDGAFCSYSFNTVVCIVIVD